MDLARGPHTVAFRASRDDDTHARGDVLLSIGHVHVTWQGYERRDHRTIIWRSFRDRPLSIEVARLTPHHRCVKRPTRLEAFSTHRPTTARESMEQRLAALVVVCVASVAITTGASGPDPAIRTVLQVFEDHGEQTIDVFLMRLRTAPLDAEGRVKVLASLRHTDEVNPTRSQREKIDAAGRILDYSGRAGAIRVMPVALDLALVGLYYRTVILTSTQALDLLNAEEFTAAVAHEVAHDYDWNDYWTARKQHDAGRMRQLELRSDGIAVLTLARVGMDPERLVSAVEKVNRYNRMRDAAIRQDLGGAVVTTHDRYVPLNQRVAFIRAVARIPWADGRSTAVAQARH
jgi:hypothetical protein